MLARKIPEGSCSPPTPGDVLTQQCITKAETKSAASIDEACFTAPATAPSCYDGTLLRPNRGAGWTPALVGSVIDGQVPMIGCGSPSGAFVE